MTKIAERERDVPCLLNKETVLLEVNSILNDCVENHLGYAAVSYDTKSGVVKHGTTHVTDCDEQFHCHKIPLCSVC